MPTTVFISHNSKDKRFARRLAADLKARGLSPWLDEDKLRPGDSLIGRLESAIDEVDYMIVVLSPDSVGSRWVQEEVRMAMYNAIMGKQIIVVPVLYKTCKTPGFLREKLYIDFREKGNYEYGLRKIVDRVRTDRVDDPDTAEIFKYLDGLPLTSLWKPAIRTNRFPRPFVDKLIHILEGASSGTWSPPIAMSYIYFLRSLLENGPLTKDSWQCLCRITENEDINVGLRQKTLETMLNASSDVIERNLGAPPALLSPDETPNSVLAACVHSLFTPAEEGSITGDPGTSPRILGTLWGIVDHGYRRQILSVLESYISEEEGDSDSLLDPLRALITSPQLLDISDAFFSLRKSWHAEQRARPGPSNASLSFRDLLDSLRSKKGTQGTIEKLVQYFVDASILEAKKDYSLFVEVSALFEDANIALIRKIQGDDFLFKALIDIVAETRVEVVLSTIALTRLFIEFGQAALLLDDRLPEVLFTPNSEGRSKAPVVEAVSDGALLDDSKDDGLSVVMLAWIYESCTEAYRRKLRALVTKRAKKNRRGQEFLRHLNGEVSLDELVENTKTGNR